MLTILHYCVFCFWEYFFLDIVKSLVLLPYVFQSQNISNVAMNSQNVSSMLNESALLTEDKVENDLSDLLDEIKNRLAQITGKIATVSGDLSEVAINFPEFEEKASQIGKFLFFCIIFYTVKCHFMALTTKSTSDHPGSAVFVMCAYG